MKKRFWFSVFTSNDFFVYVKQAKDFCDKPKCNVIKLYSTVEQVLSSSV